MMYFKPPQNNLTSPFYHPLNQKLNEQKYTKARVMFNNASDARRDMRVAKETGLYQSATEKPSGRGRVYEITFKSEGQFRRFMSQFEVDLMEYPLKEGLEIDEAVKTKVEKTSQGFQVMVFSPTVKKFIPQGSPHKTRAAAEKDAKMFEGNYSVTSLNEPHRVQKKKQTRKANPIKEGVEIDESRDDFDDFDVKAAQDDRMYTAKKFIDALKKAGIKHEYVRYSGTMRVVKKDLGKAQSIGKKLKADKVGIRMDVLREDVQEGFKEPKKVNYKGGTALPSTMAKGRKPVVISTPRGYIVQTYDKKRDIFSQEGPAYKTKAEAEKAAKLLEDVQLDEKVMTFTFRKTEDAREFKDKAFSLANSTDIMMMPGGKTGVEVSTMGPKDDKSLISLAKKMGGRLHKVVEDVQVDETNFRFPQAGEYYGDLGKSISDDPYDFANMSKAELEKRSRDIQRKFDAVMRKHKRTKVGEVLDILDKDGGTKLYKDSDIKQIGKYLTKFKDNVRRVAHQMLIDVMEGDDYLAKKRIPVKEDVQLDEVTGETTVMAKGDQNQYERITRALTAAKKAGKIAGYEGAHYNYKTKVLTLIFDSKAHKPASERRKVAKMIKDFGLEFSHSVEEGLRQAMSGPKETPAQKQKRQEKDNFDLYKKRQARIAALRGDRSSRKLTKNQEKDYMMRVNLDQIKALTGKKKR